VTLTRLFAKNDVWRVSVTKITKALMPFFFVFFVRFVVISADDDQGTLHVAQRTSIIII